MNSLNNLTQHYSTARAITGTWKGISREKLYSELGWESLTCRRWSRRLTFFYKIINNLTPAYAKDLIQPLNQSNYTLRNQDVVGRIRTRTEIFKSSFYPNTKYLGVQLDEHLSWSFECNWPLEYAKKCLPIAVVKTLYSSIVEPHFQYCCSVWGCCNSTDILQLQRLQNRAARVLTTIQFDAPSKPLIQSLGWQTIGQLIDRQSKLTVFKCLNDFAPRY